MKMADTGDIRAQRFNPIETFGNYPSCHVLKEYLR
jgi:hypothetical protein